MANAILKTWQTDLEFKLVKDPCWQVLCYDSVSSTMDSAKEHLKNVTAQSPLLVLAKEQTSGRGRHGSAWSQPEQGMYATFAFASTIPTNLLTGLSLACGCALRSALAAFGCELKLKWPNDLLSRDGQKICGVLIELSTTANSPSVLIGIGVNIKGAPGDIDNVASVESLSGQTPTPVEVASRVSPALWQCWQKFQTGGFESFRNEWRANATGIGKQIKVESAGQIFEGVFEDVANNGALDLRDQAGVMHSIVSGHVMV